MNKDWLLKNKSIVIVVIVVIVAAVAGVIYINRNNASGSSTVTKSPIAVLTDRVDAHDLTISSLTSEDTALQDSIDALTEDTTVLQEDYADYSDNMATLLQKMASLEIWQTNHNSSTLIPTPTPTANASPTATPTVNATPTVTPTPTATPTATPIPNGAPVIDTFIVDPPVLEASEWYTLVTCTAHDPDGDALTYTWAASNGAVNGVGSSVWWIKTAAGVNGSIGVIVSDGHLAANYTAAIRCNP